MAGEVTERCPTGITGFDAMTQGGFVRNSSNVVVGGPGSGKSTFLLEFLYRGVTQFSENGLYCSFEPDILDTLNDAFMHGWDFFRLAEEGKIKFIKFSPDTSVDELKNELTRLISQNDIRRICFDPVSVLALNINDGGKIRERVFDLVSLMKRLRVTSILADESMESENGLGENVDGEWTKTDIIKFLSDSVTVLYTNGLTGEGDRTIKVEKMRRTNHNRTFIGMNITDKGMNIMAQTPTQQVTQQMSQQVNDQMQSQQQSQAPQPTQQDMMNQQNNDQNNVPQGNGQPSGYDPSQNSNIGYS